MIILNTFYESNDLQELIKNLEFEEFSNGQILPNFEYNPPGLDQLLFQVLHFNTEINNSIFFKPNSGMIINQHFSLYVLLSDTTLITYKGEEVYNRVELKNGQAIILEPLVTHSFDAELLQFIEFRMLTEEV